MPLMEDTDLRSRIIELVGQASKCCNPGKPEEAIGVVDELMSLFKPYLSGAAMRLRGLLFQWHNATERCVCRDCRLVREHGTNEPEQQILSKDDEGYLTLKLSDIGSGILEIEGIRISIFAVKEFLRNPPAHPFSVKRNGDILEFHAHDPL